MFRKGRKDSISWVSPKGRGLYFGKLRWQEAKDQDSRKDKKKSYTNSTYKIS